MLARRTSSAISLRSNSSIIRCEYYAVQSPSVWASTKVIFNLWSISTCRGLLRTMCKRLDALVATVNLPVATCSLTMQISINWGRSRCRIYSISKVATSWRPERSVKQRASCWPLLNLKSAKRKPAQRSAKGPILTMKIKTSCQVIRSLSNSNGRLNLKSFTRKLQSKVKRRKKRK